MSNTTIKELRICNTYIPIAQFDLVSKALCKNNFIECIEFSANKMDDSFSPLIRKIISTHAERRDEIVWAYGLRGETPEGIEYRKGLHEIILCDNKFTNSTMYELCKALLYDSYILSFDIKGNKIEKEGINEAIQILNENKTIVAFDIRDNPGYDVNLHSDQIALLLSRNLRHYKLQPILHDYITSKKVVNKELLQIKFQNVISRNYNQNKRKCSTPARQRICQKAQTVSFGKISRPRSVTAEKATQTLQKEDPSKSTNEFQSVSTNYASPMKESKSTEYSKKIENWEEGDVKRRIVFLMRELTDLMDTLEIKKKAVPIIKTVQG